MSVRGDCRPPPTPTDKPSAPKVLRHPFRDRGLQLPQWRRAQRNDCPRCRPGRRNQPCDPNSGGGGPLCMPLCFWATQTVVAASGLFVAATRSKFTPYLPPHSAAVCIQRPYRHHYVNYARDTLPIPRGPFRSILGSKDHSDKQTLDSNASYRHFIPHLYQAWAGRPFIEMVHYHDLLWSLDPDKWPKPSGSILSSEYKGECYAQHLVRKEQFAESWWI